MISAKCKHAKSRPDDDFACLLETQMSVPGLFYTLIEDTNQWRLGPCSVQHNEVNWILDEYCLFDLGFSLWPSCILWRFTRKSPTHLKISEFWSRRSPWAMSIMSNALYDYVSSHLPPFDGVDASEMIDIYLGQPLIACQQHH